MTEAGPREILSAHVYAVATAITELACYKRSRSRPEGPNSNCGTFDRVHVGYSAMRAPTIRKTRVTPLHFGMSHCKRQPYRLDLKHLPGEGIPVVRSV